MIHRAAGVSCFVLALAFATGLPAHASEDFYQGNKLRLLIGHPAGSPGYDIFGRIVARHLRKHIPGNPVIIVENMPGAASLSMMNYLYSVAPKDGTVFGQAAKSVLLEPLYGNELARFDPLKMHWLGSAQSEVNICYTLKPNDVTTIDGARKREVIVGSTGPTGDSSFIPLLVNHLIGTRFKTVLGYPDGTSVALAVERGELEGACGFTMGSVRTSKPEWFSQKKINILFQATLDPSRQLPDVPTLASYANEEMARQMLEVALSTGPLTRAIVTPPGVPADRVEILRRAFDATMTDQAFLQDAERLQYEIDPISGQGAQALLQKLYAMPRDAVERVIAVKKRR